MRIKKPDIDFFIQLIMKSLLRIISILLYFVAYLQPTTLYAILQKVILFDVTVSFVIN